MRVKLIVVHTERGGEPRPYVLDQDTITIGRAGTCDVPLEDPDRVVSKAHAELHVDGDGLRVTDLGSKNHTFVNGERVGTSGRAVRDGDLLQVGPFQVTVQIERDLMVADDLDRTVFGAAFNPYGDEAEAVAAALGDLRRAFGTRADPGALRDALAGALGPGPDADAVAALVAGAPEPAWAPTMPPAADEPDLDDLFGPPVDALGVPIAPAPDAPAPPPFPQAPPPAASAGPSADPFAAAPAGPTGGPDPFGTPPAASLAPAAPARDVPDDLHRALASVAVRLVSIPGKFRHEFLGHTVIHAPETAFLFDADVDALLRHLTTDEPDLRAERLVLLATAAEAVLQHHQSLLEGYRAAAREGAAVIVNGLDPDRIGDQAKGGGLLQGKERAVLDLVRERCEMMRGEDFASAERRVYRPIFSRAYLETLAHARAATAPHP